MKVLSERGRKEEKQKYRSENEKFQKIEENPGCDGRRERFFTASRDSDSRWSRSAGALFTWQLIKRIPRPVDVIPTLLVLYKTCSNLIHLVESTKVSQNCRVR